MIEGREGKVCRHSSKEAVFVLLWNHGTQRENEGDTRVHRKGVQGTRSKRCRLTFSRRISLSGLFLGVTGTLSIASRVESTPSMT